MKLIKDLWRLREGRKEYRINPKFIFRWDRRDYMFAFIPTIVWVPWICRYNGCYVVEFWWLNFNIGFGKWEHLSCRDCRHQDDCVKLGRVKWYFDNIFEKEKCRDYRSKY